MSLPPADALVAHLTVLRDAADPTHPAMAAHWREVSRWLEAAFPGRRPEQEDARQETLVSLFRSVGRMQAIAPLQAAKWVSTIHRRKRIDAARSGASDPVQAALRYARDDHDGGSPIDRLEAPAPEEPPPPMSLVDELLAEALEQVARMLEETEPKASTRQLRLRQAQAALLRLVRRLDAEAIVEALAVDEPVSKARLYKWVERGRAVVLAGLDRWGAGPDSPGEDVLDVLRTVTSARRADAGRARGKRRDPDP